MPDEEQELLSDKELQLLGQGYEDADHSCGGVSLNEYLLKAQVAKLKSLGWVSPEVRKRDIKGAMEGTKQGLLEIGYEQVWEMCSECGGAKKFQSQHPQIDLYNCPTCKGTGKVRIQFKLPEGIERKIAEILENNFDCRCVTQDERGWFTPVMDYSIQVAKQILSLIRQDKE